MREVREDDARMEQVLAELEAERFIARASATLAQVVDRDGADAVVHVVDSGIGIPPEMQRRIFELFVRGAAPARPVQGGIGIGWTLVRRLVELHGGSVKASSEGPGHGVEFVVRLALAAPHAPAARTSVAPGGAVQ